MNFNYKFKSQASASLNRSEMKNNAVRGIWDVNDVNGDMLPLKICNSASVASLAVIVITVMTVCPIEIYEKIEISERNAFPIHIQ